MQPLIGSTTPIVDTLCRLGTINGYIEFRVIKRLLYARIGDTGYALDFLQHPCGNFAVPVDIGALDLDIDGRRQTTAQNLGDDVRREEVERRAWIFPGQ